MAKTNSPLFLEIGPGLSIMIGLPTIPTWDNQSRPKEAKRGAFGFNTKTNSLEYWNGTSWFSAALRA